MLYPLFSFFYRYHVNEIHSTVFFKSKIQYLFTDIQANFYTGTRVKLSFDLIVFYAIKLSVDIV